MSVVTKPQRLTQNVFGTDKIQGSFMSGLLITYVLFIHMMSQHAKSGLKQAYFSVCLSYLKFIALIRQRKFVIHAAFYFM